VTGDSFVQSVAEEAHSDGFMTTETTVEDGEHERNASEPLAKRKIQLNIRQVVIRD